MWNYHTKKRLIVEESFKKNHFINQMLKKGLKRKNHKNLIKMSRYLIMIFSIALPPRFYISKHKLKGAHLTVKNLTICAIKFHSLIM